MVPIPQAGNAAIVFTSIRDGSRQIYLMNADGSGQTRLTNNNSNDDYPRWSPNGAKILFESDRDSQGTGYMDIYVMNADGSQQTRLTSDANDDSEAVWSPDGTKIVFQSLRNGLYYQIYIMNADGTNQVNLSSSSAIDAEPSWSPDGTKIAFASERDHEGYASIYLMNSNGSNQHRLTFSADTIDDEQPVWSRDGSKIAFVSTRDSNKEIYVMNADGTNQTRLTNDVGNDDLPYWSPDGTKIVFRSDRQRDCCDPTSQVWVMNTDGSNQLDLSADGSDDFSASWTSGTGNQPPVANAGGSYSGLTTQAVPFNGSASFDSDGSIVAYSWNFGDGGTASGVAPTHAYATSGTFNVTLTVTDNLGAQGSATTTASISSSSSDAFVQNFHQWALLRQPHGDEGSYWADIMRAAHANGQPSMVMAAREMGKTLFESSEYAARGRSDHDYVYDLYKTYLVREPDSGGWAYWEYQITYGHIGREAVGRAFDESGEFISDVGVMTVNGSASSAVSSLLSARSDPNNQTGEQLLARDCEWSVPLLSLPGRAGLDLGLGLSYSSLVWTRSGPYVYFDEDNGTPSPGFRLGFPTIQEQYFDAQSGANVYLLISASGRRVELRQVGTSNVYEAADSSYLQLLGGSGSLLLRTTDGTQMSFVKTVDWDEYRCTQIEDRNGNLINVNYNVQADITDVTDTLGRVITFHYDGNANLSTITQSWPVNGVVQPHTWASFGWGTVTMQPSFSDVAATGTHNGEVIPVLTQVGLIDGSHYNFEYTSEGQVNLIRRYTSDNVQRSYTSYNYATIADDCPRIMETRVSAENWTGINGVPSEVVTQFTDAGGESHEMTTPDGTIYKEFYGTGWQRGLTTESEVRLAGVVQKSTTTQWTQDNTNVSYQSNPRVTETNVYDAANNHRRGMVGYYTFTLPSGASCSLPSDAYEYQADAVHVYRRTHTDYLTFLSEFTSRRMIDMPYRKSVYDSGGALVAKIDFWYDWGGEYLASTAAAPTQHDGSYDTTFTLGRGNLTQAMQFDVTDPFNESKGHAQQFGYDTDGSLMFQRDPLGHQSSISYADSFSDGNNSRNTFAYPTIVKDPDWNATTAPNNYSTAQYNFDMGVKTRVQGPPPDNQPNGIIQTFAYDNAVRIQQVTTTNNNAYTRYVYGPNYTQSFSSVNNVADDAYAVQFFDGAGRPIMAARNHPGSQGGYSAVVTVYDLMGRAIKQSNPTETDAVGPTWQARGDDSVQNGGYDWLYTQQTYDWKGRPRITTNTDLSQKSASYSVCGCAGSEVTTLTDEMNRQQTVYSDVLGRTAKTEVLNWDSTVYATTVNTYNARDQVTLVRQYQGNDQSGVYQDTTMGYDGYGRLQSKHVPEQNAGTATTYAYNNDDTPYSVTDARGAAATYAYNARHLVTGITYTAPPGSGIATPSAVGYGYDAAGNRTSMSDGMGTVDYSYDQLSRLQWENRSFNGVTNPNSSDGKFKVSYDYNLAGELKTITDPTNDTINYGYDQTGRLSNVTGINYSVSQFVTGMAYRAWGAPKQISYGNGRSESMTYNPRLQITHFEVPNVMAADYQYNNDGTLSYSHDLVDNRFDRSYTYDHEARITQGLSGAEARGGGPTNDRPYNETLAYDALEHMTYHGTRHWSKTGAGYVASDTYTNDRRNGWQYDANGNLTNDLARQYTYDAGGRMILISNSSLNLNQYFDGDGQRVKMTEPNVVTYYVKSTVLGGQVVEDVDGTGNKQTGYIYMGGSVLAEQYPTGGINLVHKDASGVSIRKTNAQYGNANVFTELDPLGADAEMEDPYINNPNYNGRGEGGPLYPGFGNITAPSTGCTLDGVWVPCDWITRGLEAGTIANEYMTWSQKTMPVLKGRRGTDPGNTGITIGGWTTEQIPIISFGLGLYGKDVPVIRYNNEGQYSGFELELFTAPQNSDKAIASAVDRARTILSTKNPCSDYFGGNAIKAVNAFEQILTRGYPNGPGDTHLGIQQSGQQTTHENPTQYRTFQNAVINNAGPFFNLLSTTRFGGYNPGSHQSQVLQIFHELAHLVYSGGAPLIPDDAGPTKKVDSEANTREVLKHCRDEIDKIKN